MISGAVLEAADLDTPAHQVFYFINTAPRFGKLLLKVTSVSVVQQLVFQSYSVCTLCMVSRFCPLRLTQTDPC